MAIMRSLCLLKSLLVFGVLGIPAVSDASYIDSLTASTSFDGYHMKPVRAVHARVQGDAPMWLESLSAFGSKYGGSTDSLKFRGSLDSVNTNSVEGALMYVQAEGINYNMRSVEDQCWRKNGMKFIVFYDVVFAQTNETLAEYESELGPMLPFDGGQCTPISGVDGFSKECLSLNGDGMTPNLGPFVGGALKDADSRAPYPNTWWFSLPNTCPLSKWATKTEECRASTRQGLCDFDKLPDGVSCTFNHRILGYLPIDDVVGITSMTNPTTGENYADFTEFCADGGVEFKAASDGTSSESIPFWENPLDPEANAARAGKVLAAYTSLLASGSSSQIDGSIVAKMQALPTVPDLAAENPPCYENVYTCAFAEFGCKRELYSQICTVCEVASEGCVVAPSDFTFPKLVKATVKTITSGSSSSSSSWWDDSITTPAPTSGPPVMTPRSTVCAKKPKTDANSSKIYGGPMDIRACRDGFPSEFDGMGRNLKPFPLLPAAMQVCREFLPNSLTTKQFLDCFGRVQVAFAAACECGASVSTLAQLVTTNEEPHFAKLVHAAARNGDVELLKWLTTRK